jgi:hypothetical protein
MQSPVKGLTNGFTRPEKDAHNHGFHPRLFHNSGETYPLLQSLNLHPGTFPVIASILQWQGVRTLLVSAVKGF